ncbi:MAG: outer membrane beta-barrel protein [Chitinophagaceae bacterium]|nr:outer membrane beta-barrel protein [Chitinophagaceae bacterium]
MKESNFYSDDFEQLLREKTEQYKMYPSEKVWKGIHGSLHTKRRWFITSMSLLVTGILFFAGRELLSPSKAELNKRAVVTTRDVVDPGSNEEGNTSPLAALSGQHHNTNSSITGRRSTSGADDRSYKGINVRISGPAESHPDISGMLSQVVSLPAQPPSIPLITVLGHSVPPAGGVTEDGSSSSVGYVAQTGRNAGVSGNIPGMGASTDRSLTISSNAPLTAGNVENASAKDIDLLTHAARNNAHSRNALAVTRSASGAVTGSETLVDSTGKTASGKVVFTDAIADQQRINWLYDYAVYNLPAAAKRGRKYLQMYVSPTVTYRTISGGIPTSKNYYLHGDGKDYVDHTPSLGFEVGGVILYRVTRNLTIKGGLQFNFSRYTMKAYANPQQATADLNTYYGYCLDSVIAQATSQPFVSKPQSHLTNDFYQLSAPIGFELRVMGNERLQLHIGASIQPSYLLNTNAYLLTTDYVNYVKGPAQFRRWNLTGGLEAFLSYKLHNGLRLQAGPEFRYQLLSTFNDGYPIRENMKGYGLKIGIVKAIP